MTKQFPTREIVRKRKLCAMKAGFILRAILMNKFTSIAR